MLNRLDAIEYRAEIIISEMEVIEARIADLLTLNNILNAAVECDPELWAAANVAQDELELEFNSLVSLFEGLEAELAELGDEYDSLIFVVSLALPA